MQPNKRFFAVCLAGLILFVTGCSSEVQPDEPQVNQSTVTNPTAQSEPFRDAVNKAMEAAKLAQTAKTSEEWSEVANSWQQSINLMKAVQSSSPNHKTAQQKAVQYRTNLEYAQRNARTASSPSPTPSSAVSTLPPHQMSETSLGNGKRIQIDAKNPQLSHDECSRLAEKYATAAGQGGQVVVQKPNPSAPWNGKLLPFCIDNLDGKGVSFNDFYFQ